MKWHEATVRLLPKNSANPEAKDNSGRTPLLWATKKRHEAVIDRGPAIKAKDEDGQTLLRSSSNHTDYSALPAERMAKKLYVRHTICFCFMKCTKSRYDCSCRSSVFRSPATLPESLEVLHEPNLFVKERQRSLLYQIDCRIGSMKLRISYRIFLSLHSHSLLLPSDRLQVSFLLLRQPPLRCFPFGPALMTLWSCRRLPLLAATLFP